MNPLLDIIFDEIDRTGPLRFSRYMELALYHPELGFYAGGGAGRRRDFITSPEVGPLFGAVVARAIDAWWERLGSPAEFVVVDAGAGPGTLARSVLRSAPRCADALRYVTVESSAAQRDRHPDAVEASAVMPDAIEHGLILANELLDNLPFDVVSSIDGGPWQEVRVGRSATALTEELTGVDERLPPPPDSPGETRMPLQRAARRWLDDAHRSLRSGGVVVIDYAVPAYPVLDGRGWLRTYAEHGPGGSPLEAPGTKDITADVDISALAQVATPTVVTQADWLRAHGIDALVEEGREHWAEHAARPDLFAMEMRSRITEAEALLDPGGLGGFTVAEWSTP